MRKVVAAVAVLVVLAFLGAMWWWSVEQSEADKYAQCRTSNVGSALASIGGPFELMHEDGMLVTDRDLITKPTLLYFGYSFCPDVCPLDTVRNADAYDILKSRGYEDIQIAFISIDHERDNAERMKEFTDFIHDDMIGLSGTKEQVLAASQSYKTYFKKEENGDPEFFLIDHSTFAYLVFPEEGVVEFFRRDETPEEVADAIACFLDAAKE